MSQENKARTIRVSGLGYVWPLDTTRLGIFKVADQIFPTVWTYMNVNIKGKIVYGWENLQSMS
jgi:hypothetical protein